MSKLQEKYPVGSVWMLKNGDKAIVIHIDKITQSAIFYNYVLGKNVTYSYKLIQDGQVDIGLWQEEWLRESSKYEGIISVILPEANSRLLGSRKVFGSQMAIERCFDDSAENCIWTAQHQEFYKIIQVNRGDNILKILRDTYEYFSLAVDIENPDILVTRIPIEFSVWLDEWSGKRFIKFYTRLSLIKDNKQVIMKFNDSDGMASGATYGDSV